MSWIDPDAIEVASISDVGRQRSTNQDSYGEGHAPSGARLIMVADGMGGHAGGETASRVAVERVREFVAASEAAPQDAMRAALEAANGAVHEEARRNAQLAGMGTTGVAMLFSADGGAVVANVGDSRAYLLRDGHLEQITLDHSLVAELQRRGILSEEEALVHPRRNEVLRSLGVEPEVTVDIHSLEVRPGDVFLLCSDGLSGVVRDAEIAEVLRSEPPAQAVRTLVDFANERGGPDNVTVQIARIPAEGETTAIPGPAAGAGSSDRHQSIRALSVALLVVASLLAVALLWALVGELRQEPEAAAALPVAPEGEALEPEEVGELLPPEESLFDE